MQARFSCFVERARRYETGLWSGAVSGEIKRTEIPLLRLISVSLKHSDSAGTHSLGAFLLISSILMLLEVVFHKGEYPEKKLVLHIQQRVASCLQILFSVQI